MNAHISDLEPFSQGVRQLRGYNYDIYYEGNRNPFL